MPTLYRVASLLRNLTPLDPTVGLCLGPYESPTGGGRFLMSEVPLQVPLRHSLGGGAFMATLSVCRTLKWRGGQIRPSAGHRSLLMAYSRSVLSIQGIPKVSLGGAEWTDWRGGLCFRAEGLSFKVPGLGITV